MRVTENFLLLMCALLIGGCMIPNTKNDPFDDYAYALRWYNRGDYVYATKYFEKLAAKGDCDSEYWLGLIYFLGQGKTPDNIMAMHLWVHAAAGNHPKAQGAMGDVYYQKDAVIFHHCKSCVPEKDLVQAYLWYKLMDKSARYDGEKEYASKAIKAIFADMTQEQILRGDSLLQNWKQTNLDCKPRHWW